MTATPGSLEHERALLGAAMRDATVLDEVAVPEADWMAPQYGALWSLMQAMRRRSIPVDMVTVPQAVGKSSQAARLPTVGDVAALPMAAPSTADVPYYAEQIREAARRRRFFFAAQRLAEEVASGATEPEAAVRQLEEAGEASVSPGTWQHIGDVMAGTVETIRRRAETPGAPPDVVPTGWRALDHVLVGLEAGGLYLVGGSPGMGKSAFAVQMAQHISGLGLGAVGVFSLEMRATLLAERLLVAAGDMDAQRVRHGRIKADALRTFEYVAEEARGWDLWVDDRSGLALEQVEVAARELARSGPVAAIFVDYLQIMRTEQARGDNRAGTVRDLAYGLCTMARRLGCPVVALSQLNRKVADRKDKRPMMSDLFESGGLEQAADAVLLLYRDGYYNECSADAGMIEVIVGKQRRGPTGPVRLRWEASTGRIVDFEEHL